MVGAVRSVNPFVEDVDSTAGSRREEPILINVWVGIGVGVDGVVCSIFLRNPTASPSSPSSPSFPPPSAPSSFSATPGLH